MRTVSDHGVLARVTRRALKIKLLFSFLARGESTFYSVPARLLNELRAISPAIDLGAAHHRPSCDRQGRASSPLSRAAVKSFLRAQTLLTSRAFTLDDALSSLSQSASAAAVTKYQGEYININRSFLVRARQLERAPRILHANPLCVRPSSRRCSKSTAIVQSASRGISACTRRVHFLESAS